MRVRSAEDGDIAPWLILASGVEHVLGPLVSSPRFHQALIEAMDRRAALCVREVDGPAGSPLAGGLLYSGGDGEYNIDWLAAAAEHRRQGVGKALVEAALKRIGAPAVVTVTVYRADEPVGTAARRFYLNTGFRPLGPSPHSGPRGERLEVLRRRVA